MNNEIKENNLQNNDENQNNNHFYKVNFLKTDEKEITSQTPINDNQNNKLYLSPAIKKKKLRKEDKINRSMLISSFRTKRRKIISSNRNDKPLDSPKSRNSPKNILNPTNNNIYNNKEKEILYEDRNLFKSKISVNYYNNHYNNNNKCKNEKNYLNILNYANKLYENEEHFKKRTLIKKIDINDIPNIKKYGLFMSGRIKSKIFEKKTSVIKGNNNKNLKSIKRNLGSAIKVRPFKELNKIKEKISFSNVFKTRNPKIKRGNELFRHFYRNNIGNTLILDNNNIKHYKPNKNGDITVKVANMNYEKYFEEKADKNDDTKINLKNSIKVDKTKNQKKENVNNNTNRTNDLAIIKRESPKNKENKIENSLNKKKKKFWFFCCLNSK